MKRIIALFIISCFLFCLCSCDIDPYQNKRPIDYVESTWVCKEYDLQFSVNADHELIDAEALIQEQRVPFTFLWSSLDNKVTIKFEIAQTKDSLLGKCDFGEKQFSIYIDDTKNYYAEKQITMVFERTD